MRITELLVESQQLDEGPFTQAVGKVGGKIARGVANIGKDLKTGFKAGYSGEEPPADTAAPAADPAATTQAAPVKKAAPAKVAGTTAPAATPKTSGGGGFVDQIKKGFAQGRGEIAADTPTAPAAATTAAPAADPAAEKQSKIGVGQINKIIPTLRTRDLMSLQANLEKTIASKKKAPPAAPAASAAPASTAPAETPPSTPATTAPADVATTASEVPKKTRSRKKAAAPTQAEIDADRNRLMGNFSDSIERHKQRMVAEGFANGSISIFKQ
jgi:hypothetical protein